MATYQNIGAFPTRKTQDGEQLYATALHTHFDPAGYGRETGEVELNHSADGIFEHGSPLGKVGDCGIRIRSGYGSLGCHVWLVRYEQPADRTVPFGQFGGEYKFESFSMTPEQMIAMGQALLAMGVTEQARAAMTECDRISAAVDNIHNLAAEQHLNEEETRELRVRVQKELTQRVR